MSDPQLMNDDAARSATGEILDQASQTTTETAKPAESDSTSTTTEPKADTPTTTEPKAGETLLSDKKEEAKETPKAPDTYTDFKVPDGYTLTKEALDAALPVFKELNLTQDQAQKLVDIQIAREIAIAKAPEETYSAMRTDWRAKTLSDPEIKSYTTEGKTGMDAVKIDIGRALGTIDPALADEFRSVMNTTGVGDNPAFVKTFWKMAQSVIEGKPVSGRGPSPLGQKAPGTADKPSPARALYPNLG